MPSAIIRLTNVALVTACWNQGLGRRASARSFCSLRTFWTRACKLDAAKPCRAGTSFMVPPLCPSCLVTAFTCGIVSSPSPQGDKMKKLLVVLLSSFVTAACTCAGSGAGAGGGVSRGVGGGGVSGGHRYTRGYTRSDGTYVRGHYSSRPNRTSWDNWSTRGNTNPYTGKRGYRRR